MHLFQIIDEYFEHLLLAIFSTLCNQLDSDLANLEATVKSGIGISFSNNSVVARAR